MARLCRACFYMATQAVHLTKCKDLWSISPGDYVPQNTLFFLLTWPESRKWASSLNQTLLKTSGSSLIFSRRTTGTSQFVFVCQLLWADVWSLEQDSSQSGTGNSQLLAALSSGLLWAPSNRISHGNDIFFSSRIYLRAIRRTDTLVEVVYCSLIFKPVHPPRNLALMRIVVEVKFPAVFC